MIDNAAAQVSNVQAHKVRALFITTPTRSSTMPDVPTADEAGLSGFIASGWFGLAAPKGTPQAIVDKLNTAIARGLAQPDLRKRLVDAGWMPVGSSPSDAAARARADLIRFGAAAQALKLQKESAR